jgi:type VI secretion system protein ImpG
LYQPTDTVYPTEEGATQWQLVSQLALNYLSLSNNEESLDALKEMLRLYSGGGKKVNDVEINSIIEMQCTPIVRRFGVDAWRGFTKGTSVILTIDEGASASLGSFLFSSVLAHFFGLYTTINSFVEVTVKSTRREGIWKKWPPIAGAQELL